MADYVIAVSPQWQAMLSRIARPERVGIFRNCVAVESVPYSPTESEIQTPQALFLGSIGPRKGAFDLIEAVERMHERDVALGVWIAGYEERAGDLAHASSQIKAAGLEDVCKLVGTVHGEAKRKLLANADLFVLPSYNEGLPIAILEAQAAGLAVISTPVGGIPEVVKDGHNGYLVMPGDVETLAQRLTILAVDPDLRALMGRRSHELVTQELNVRPYVKRLVALYSALLDRREESRDAAYA